MSNLICKYIQKDKLKDYIKNTQCKPGEIFISKDRFNNTLVYVYNPEDENPYWLMLDTTSCWKTYFDNMSLEEKVDYLINKEIDRLAR